MNSIDRKILEPLIDRILELAFALDNQAKKKLWADHQALRPTDKIPVCLWFEFIPEPQWRFMFGKDYLRCESDQARKIERELRKQLWMADHVPDDHIVWPMVSVTAALSRSVSWGVEFHMEGTDETADDPLEAMRIVPAFPDGIEAGRVRFADMEVDRQETDRCVEEARELVGDRLRVIVVYPNLSYAPFDLAVKMRGLENIMLDVMDTPQSVHELMEAITTGFERHHKNREARGWLNVVPDEEGCYTRVGFRVHCAYPVDDFDAARPRLKDEWAYISAQTSSGLGPGMFAEFVHPYNARLARFFPNETVYFHGCECLDHKLGTLAGLPNLRRFHVSPWSSVEKAREKLGGRAVLEVHAHPGRVFFAYTREQMKAEISERVAAAEGAALDMNLSDIHSINEQPERLWEWAAVAQEVAAASG